MNVDSKMGWIGVFTLKHFRDGELIGEDKYENKLVDEGKDYLVGLSLNNDGTAKVDTWYATLYTTNITPDDDETAASAVGDLGEVTGSEVTNGTRPQWVPNTSVANNGALSSNSEDPALFTMNASVTIHGAYIVSTNVIGVGSGTLLAASKFGTGRAVLSADVLQLTYNILLA